MPSSGSAILTNPYAGGLVRLSDDWVLGPVDEWEGTGLEGGSIVSYAGYRYIFYAAFHSSLDLSIGWMRCPEADYPLGPYERSANNPVFTHDQQPGIDDLLVATPRVQRLLNGSWRMDYHTYNGVNEYGCVAFCESANFPDGPWVPYAGNPIISPGSVGEWDAKSIHNEITMPAWETCDNKWHCFYGGATGGLEGQYWRGGHAISNDGLVWTKVPGLAIAPVAGSSWCSLGVHPVSGVIRAGEHYYMLVQGFNGTTWQLGVFASVNLYFWFEMPGNPVLSPRPGKWDAGAIEDPHISFENGKVTAFYISEDVYLSTNYRWGVARTT